jgi:hypothetical protein
MTRFIHPEHGYEERAALLTPAARQLARMLYGIERFGRTTPPDDPPPLFTDLAYALMRDSHHRNAVKRALGALDGEGNGH